MTYAKQSEFARKIGYDKSRITQLKQAGRIVMSPDGRLVDVEASIARIAETSDPGRMDVTERHATRRIASGKAAPASAIQTAIAPISDASLGLENSGRAKAKAALMHYENGLLKIEMALRRGLRYERAAVNRESSGLGAMVRAGIERVIDQTAPRLAATTSPIDRRIILDKEIKRLRWMIRRELPRALRRMKYNNTPKATHAD